MNRIDEITDDVNELITAVYDFADNGRRHWKGVLYRRKAMRLGRLSWRRQETSDRYHLTYGAATTELARKYPDIPVLKASKNVRDHHRVILLDRYNVRNE